MLGLNVYDVVPFAVAPMESEQIVVSGVAFAAEVEKDGRVGGRAVGDEDVDMLLQLRPVRIRMVDRLQD